MKERTSGLETSLNSSEPLDDLNKQKTELQDKIEQDHTIIDDPDAAPSEKAAAREWVEETFANADCGKERALPLRERVRENSKNTA